MTVCVAAITDSDTILAASDQMLTAGDIQFQPDQSKMWFLTSSIFGMVAGDTGIAVGLLNRVQAVVRDRVDREPQRWWLVSEVAELYRDVYSQVRTERAAHKFLAPLGLNSDTFIGRQREMSPDLVKQLATELINFDLPGVSIIFAGIDATGPHLFVAHNGSVTCNDAAGFAAIGSGYWHAESQCMLAGHTRRAPLSKTLWLTYLAKRRGEIAPGVGSKTDMLISGPALGSTKPIKDEILSYLVAAYKKYETATAKQAIKFERDIHGFIGKITQAASAPTQAVPEAIDGATPTDDAGDRPVIG